MSPIKECKNTYIIGHYKPLVRIIDIVSHIKWREPTYRFVLISGLGLNPYFKSNKSTTLSTRLWQLCKERKFLLITVRNRRSNSSVLRWLIRRDVKVRTPDQTTPTK